MVKIEDDDFDFGFSTEEDKVEIFQNEVEDYRNRLDKLYKAILPLLNNLEKNPDQEVIKWPNRDKKIKEFKLKIKNIVEGKK